MAIKIETKPTKDNYGSSRFIPKPLAPIMFRFIETKSLQELLAIYHACPIPEAVAKYYAATGVDGHLAGFNRYNECNIITARLWHLVADRNPALYHKLTSWKNRNVNEPVGHFENGRVPQEHLSELSPLSTIFGYAISRIIIEIMNFNKKEGFSQENVWKLLPTYIDRTDDPEKLLALLSNYAISIGVSPTIVFHHIFAQGIMDEECTSNDFRALRDALNGVDPNVMKIYGDLNSDVRARNGILQRIP